eukprot:CAMPEP_0183333942 /NCGR_PEP_ID=MMETSP0164_2-20130417/2692_1 /TAXON_ID=221442 /ORGANISM="Coccolithus pelagicus ssp braarudi, Strain PLY182g" /LENGTH=177 /DNA_ID=CAMNT_0025502983 /DNA_START=462 /DNA_END=992 /DNA_ORIENTATION=+
MPSRMASALPVKPPPCTSALALYSPAVSVLKNGDSTVYLCAQCPPKNCASVSPLIATAASPLTLAGQTQTLAVAVLRRPVAYARPSCETRTYLRDVSPAGRSPGWKACALKCPVLLVAACRLGSSDASGVDDSGSGAVLEPRAAASNILHAVRWSKRQPAASGMSSARAKQAAAACA